MTPDQLTAVASIQTFLEKLGGMPLYIIILTVEVGPWILVFFFVRYLERRFQAMTEMYKDNVILVKDYEKIAGGLMDCVVANTTKWTEVSDQIRSNQFCPLNRIRKVKMEDVPQ